MTHAPQQTGAQLDAFVLEVAESWRVDLAAAARLGASQRDTAVRDTMDRQLDRLAATGIWGPANQLASSRLWQIVGPQLTAGSLQLRAREKPLGYAGDFQLLERICLSDVQGHELAESFDTYFQNHAAPQAVRNRARILAQAIATFVTERSEPVRVVSYGSGPAFELRLACQELDERDRDRLHITLIDIDPRALEFAASRLYALLPQRQVETVRANLNRLPKMKQRDQLFPPADFIFASGVFDYLNREDAAATIRYFWRRLHSHGAMFIFNFCQSNPSRAYMEWVANWYLNYRSDEDMRTLAVDSHLPDAAWQTDIEPAAANRFLTAVKLF